MKRLKPAAGPREGVRSAFHRQAVFGTSFTVLTSGVFLSGLAMYMGASDLLVSYISMIANICGVSILFFSPLMERTSGYKRAALGLTACSRLVTLLLVFIPLLVPAGARLAVFVPLMVIAFTLQAQATVVLNNWLVVYADEKKSGGYIARRQTFVLAATVLLSLGGGRALDAASGAYSGFLLLFGTAFLMALVEFVVLLRLPDAARPQKTAGKASFSDLVRKPLSCKPFRRFVIYIVLFYLLLSIADSFTVVYMMRYLKLSYVATTAMQMLISLPQLLWLFLWGRLSDKKGHRFALVASIWFFTGETLFLALSNLQNCYFLIPAAFLFASVANAGFVVSVFNRRYELMPREGRILYDNFYSAAIGAAFILGPVTGGAVKSLLEANTALATAIPFGNIRLLYVISTVGILLLQLGVHWGIRREKRGASG